MNMEDRDMMIAAADRAIAANKALLAVSPIPIVNEAGEKVSEYMPADHTAPLLAIRQRFASMETN